MFSGKKQLSRIAVDRTLRIKLSRVVGSVLFHRYLVEKFSLNIAVLWERLSIAFRLAQIFL